jgi:predicted nucleic acid-binding protein
MNGDRRRTVSRQFVDANILVYSLDPSAGIKLEKAKGLLEELWRERVGCLSLQVLQEFFVTVTRKIPSPLTAPEAGRKVAQFAEWTLHLPDKSDLLAAIELHQDLGISFWDAMVIQSARRLGCRLLWSEDLNHDQTYAGVTVRDPFRDLVMEESAPYGQRA